MQRVFFFVVLGFVDAHQSHEPLDEQVIHRTLAALEEVSSCGNQIPKMHCEAKAKMKRFGMGYEMIDVCTNDYVLFRKDLEKADVCPVCNESSWKPTGKIYHKRYCDIFP